MTIDFEYYRKINGLSGATSKKDYYNKQIIKSIDTAYNNTLSTFEILINSVRAENIIADNIERKCIFDYSKETTDKNTKTDLASYSKEMWIEANVINVGSIIEHIDRISLTKNIYLVVSKQEDTRGFDKCFIQKTNNTLKFYDKNHVLYEIPCIISNSVSIGNEENKYITTVDNEFYLTVSNNSTTQQIKVNDIYKVGSYNYQIESVPDDISQKGLLIFKMKYNPESQEEHVYTISILNGTLVDIQQDSKLQLNIQVYNNQTPISPTPLLNFTSSNETVCTVDSNGLITGLGIGSCVVNVSLVSDSSVNKEIGINVIEVPKDNITVTISGNTSIIKGYTSEYSATFLNNGVEYSEQSEFYLTADDGVSPTTLAEIISQDSINNTCVVKGLNIGYVKLWVKNLDGSVVSEPLRIQIKNLF